MIETPRTLIPFILRECLSLRQAAALAGKSQTTLRAWCQNHYIGRRVGGGPWIVSRVALAMFLDGDAKALAAYLKGDRKSELVLSYFRRAGVRLCADNPADSTEVAKSTEVAERAEVL